MAQEIVDQIWHEIGFIVFLSTLQEDSQIQAYRCMSVCTAWSEEIFQQCIKTSFFSKYINLNADQMHTFIQLCQAFRQAYQQTKLLISVQQGRGVVYDLKL
jgi:hypothetical protein